MNDAPGRGEIQDAVNRERRRLHYEAVADVKTPRETEFSDIAIINLAEGTIPLLRIATTVREPIGALSARFD